jgi:Helix-turn-helix domain
MDSVSRLRTFETSSIADAKRQTTQKAPSPPWRAQRLGAISTVTERTTGPRRRAKSLSAVWRDAVRDSNLPALVKAVAFVVSTYSDGRGQCFPSRGTLASGASMSDRTVDKALDLLETTGWLSIHPPKRAIETKRGTVLRRAGGKSVTNTYTLLLAATANVIRTSEWQRANAAFLKSEPDDVKSERGSHESFESFESSGGRLNGAAPLDDCMRCSERRPLDSYRGRLVCRHCILEETGELEGQLRDHIFNLKAAA